MSLREFLPPPGSHQYALVHVPVFHVQADADDAAVVHLLVVEGQGEVGVVGHGRHGALVGASGREGGGRGNGGGRGTAGARAHPRGVQGRQGSGLPELRRDTESRHPPTTDLACCATSLLHSKSMGAWMKYESLVRLWTNADILF